MTWYLILSILCSTLLLLILKSFIRWRVDTLHGIIFNYFTAGSLALLLSPVSIGDYFGDLKPVLPFSLGVGLMFITVFMITALTTQKHGIGVASVASKMSMIIPIAAGLILYNESLEWTKSIGLLLALPAVVVTSFPSKSTRELQQSQGSRNNVLLPMLLFAGAGLVDTAIKFSQYRYMNEQNQFLIIMSIFYAAGVIGILWLAYQMYTRKKGVKIRSLLGGVLLGTANFFSLYFLIRCLAWPGSESSTVFAYVNIGVVTCSFLAGMVVFREKAGRYQFMGVALAIGAIVFLSLQLE